MKEGKSKGSGDTLVTLAIHSYEKAQILQTLLQDAGIEASLHNVNQLLPVVSAGVRVRIKEKDLPRALSLIEETDWMRDEVYSELNWVDRKVQGAIHADSPYVLIPVDFSDYTPTVCSVGFYFAQRRNLSVLIVNAYFSQFFTAAPMFTGDITGYQAASELNIKREAGKADAKMTQLKEELRRQIKEGTLPDVPFDTLLKDGAPDEVILTLAKEKPPVAIVMGTRGKSRRNGELIGSVAAEVIDSAKVPVLVVPEEVAITDLSNIENVGVATGFDQRDLVLFDRMMSLMKPIHPKYYIFNISKKMEEWSETELKAILAYHKQHYPDQEISFSMLQDGDFSEALQAFIEEKKIGMLVVNTYRRNLFARLFNPGMARRMLFHANTPLLVMHSSSWR
ncbi:universal stress protein [Porphyromonas miyakawae]|uniref:Universal stress protein n=1 Tax=Porphyromonas miyakawae TaxID=3137470 RepID=A0ABQ0E3J8_9PORP